MNVNQKFKVKQFEWFQMQTKVRQMVQEILTPVQKRIMDNSTGISKIRDIQEGNSQKITELRMMVTNDPHIFQYGIFKELDKKFQVHQKALEQLRRLIAQSNEFVQKKFQLSDIRMKQSNDSLINFAILKQHVNTQVQIQNDNINKIRQNLQKLIQKVGQQISHTNTKIAQNLMSCERADKSLEERINNAETSLTLNKESIENNRKLIIDKNIQIEMHDFKIQNIYEKIKQLQYGQSLNAKLEQFMKDMDISVKKCQFRVESITPLVTMAQVQQALQYILPQKMKKKIIVFGYKKYSKLNRQILQKRYDEVKEKFNGMQLVEAMQKKNTKQITSLKRKKIISMGIDIDHLTFQARQRYYQQVDMDELSKQQQDNPNNGKIDEAQILNLVSLYFNEFTTDVSQKVKNQLEDTKAYLYGMESQIKKQIQMNEQKILKNQTHCINFHRDQMLQMKSTQNQLNDSKKDKVQLIDWLVKNQQVQRKFYNFCSLVNHLQIQQQIDKQNISLMGIKQNKSSLQKGQHNIQKNSIIQVQKNCYSCCGYPASVLSSFKMACLAYHPSQILIDQKHYKREQILQFTTNILQTIKGNIQMENDSQNGPSMDQFNSSKLSQTINHKKVINQSFETLQKFANSRLHYSPLSKHTFEQTTTINDKTTMRDNNLSELQQNKKASSIRLRKSLRRDLHTSQQKSRADSRTKCHSMSKEMINVTNNFLDLKKRHLSYLN